MTRRYSNQSRELNALDMDSCALLQRIDDIIADLTERRKALNILHRECEQCGDVFAVPYNAIAKGRIYCTDKCKSKAWRERTT